MNCIMGLVKKARPMASCRLTTLHCTALHCTKLLLSSFRYKRNIYIQCLFATATGFLLGAAGFFARFLCSFGSLNDPDAPTPFVWTKVPLGVPFFRAVLMCLVVGLNVLLDRSLGVMNRYDLSACE